MRMRIFLMALVCLVPALGACNEPLDFSTVVPTGRLLVEVTDTSDTPIANVPVTLRLLNDSSVWRISHTGPDGRAEIGAEDGGVLTGDYLLEISPPPGYSFPRAAIHPVPLRIWTDSTATLQVRLVAPTSQEAHRVGPPAVRADARQAWLLRGSTPVVSRWLYRRRDL